MSTKCNGLFPVATGLLLCFFSFLFLNRLTYRCVQCLPSLSLSLSLPPPSLSLLLQPRLACGAWAARWEDVGDLMSADDAAQAKGFFSPASPAAGHAPRGESLLSPLSPGSPAGPGGGAGHHRSSTEDALVTAADDEDEYSDDGQDTVTTAASADDSVVRGERATPPSSLVTLIRWSLIRWSFIRWSNARARAAVGISGSRGCAARPSHT